MEQQHVDEMRQKCKMWDELKSKLNVLGDALIVLRVGVAIEEKSKELLVSSIAISYPRPGVDDLIPDLGGSGVSDFDLRKALIDFLTFEKNRIIYKMKELKPDAKEKEETEN